MTTKTKLTLISYGWLIAAIGLAVTGVGVPGSSAVFVVIASVYNAASFVAGAIAALETKT